MNASALAAWAKNTNLTAVQALVHAAGDYGFAGHDLEVLTRICRLSACAVLRGTASLHGGVDTLWTRDQFMGGIEDPHTPMARAVRQVIEAGRVEEILAERREAVSIWREIEAATQTIQNVPSELREFMVTSARYGRINYEVFEAGWTLLLLKAQGDLMNPQTIDELEEALQRYDAAWSEWHSLAETSPSCATLYDSNYCRYVRDKGMAPHTGMGDSVEVIRKSVSC